MILAASVGMTDFFGFPVTGKQDTSEEYVYQKIFEMVQDGLLEVSKDGVMASDYLKKAFFLIGNSRNILWIRPQKGERLSACFYLSKKVVCIRENIKNSQELTLQLLEPEQVWKTIEEICELPEIHIPAGILKEMNQKVETEICLQGKTLLQIEMTDRETKERKGSLILLDDSLYPILVFQTPDSQEMAYYSRWQMEEWVKCMTEEERV